MAASMLRTLSQNYGRIGSLNKINRKHFCTSFSEIPDSSVLPPDPKPGGFFDLHWINQKLHSKLGKIYKTTLGKFKPEFWFINQGQT